jgi:hypothetical protein
VLAVAGFAGYFYWATRPQTSMLDEHFAELERRREPRR